MFAARKVMMGGDTGLKFVGAGPAVTVSDYGSNTLAIPVPAFARAGDLMCVVWVSSYSSGSAPTSSGWTSFASSTAPMGQLLYMTLPASPAASYNVTVRGGILNVNAVAIPLIFRKASMDAYPGSIAGLVNPGPGTATRGAATVAGGFSVDCALVQYSAAPIITPPAGRDLVASGVAPASGSATIPVALSVYLKKTAPGTDGPAAFAIGTSSSTTLVYPFLIKKA